MKHQFKFTNGLYTLRFIAAVLIIIAHWGIYYKEKTPHFKLLLGIIPLHKVALPFFWVLSGYIMSSLLFKMRLSMPENENKLPLIADFLVKRCIRLFPIYYILFIVLYFIGFPGIADHPFYYITHSYNIFVYKTQVPNPLVHLWSLSAQEQFYLILPFFILYINEKYLKHIIYLAMAIGLGTRFYSSFILGNEFTTLFNHILDSLGLGVLYGYYMYINKQQKFERIIKFIVPLLLYVYVQFSDFRGTPLGITYAQIMWSFVVLSIIIFTINTSNKWMNKYLFENKVLNYFGHASYGIYLFHYPIGVLIDDYSKPYLKAHNLHHVLSIFILMYIIKLIIVLVVAAISYTYIETPITNLARKIRFQKPKEFSPSLS